MLIGFGGNRGRVGWPTVTQPWPVVRVRVGRVIRCGRVDGASAAEFSVLTYESKYWIMPIVSVT